MVLRRGSLSVAVVALALLAAGCGGSSGGSAAASSPAAPSPSPSPVVDTGPVAQAAVTKTWETFFNPAGSVDSHIALLENGATFRAELTASAADPTAKDLSSKVSAVAITGTTAAVTYDLLGKAGAQLLHNAVGEAVNVGGSWLVSKKTYCQLITLQDSTKPHPACVA